MLFILFKFIFILFIHIFIQERKEGGIQVANLVFALAHDNKATRARERRYLRGEGEVRIARKLQFGVGECGRIVNVIWPRRTKDRSLARLRYTPRIVKIL